MMDRAITRALGATLIAVFLTLLTAQIANAQPSDPAPSSSYSVDSNGVDVITGAYFPPYPSISIGQGPGSLAFSRSQSFEYFDTSFGSINTSGSTVTVTLFGSSSLWTVSGGQYYPAEGQGGQLGKNGNIYTFYTPSGIRAEFDTTYAAVSPYEGNAARVSEVTFPTGEKLTYGYDLEYECYEIFGDPCGIRINYVRPDSITSSLGYKLQYDYLTDTCSPFCDEDWYSATEVEVRALFGSGTWQSLSFSGDTITDALGRDYTYTRNGSGRITGVRGPGASSDDVTISYDGSGRVDSITRLGLTWTYAYSDSGSTRTTTITDHDGDTRTVTSDLASNRVLTDRNALNQTTTYTYDIDDRLKEVIAPEGNKVKYSYDARGNITEARRYNKSGSASQVIFEASYPSSCSNPRTCNQPTWTEDARGQRTDYIYNSTHGGVLTVKAPSPGGGAARPQTNYAYASYTPYNSGPTVYRLASVKSCALTTASTCSGSASERVTEVTYWGNWDRVPTVVTARSGNSAVSATTNISYDYQRRVSAVDGPLSGSADTTRTFYNVVGQVTGVIGPDPDGGGALKYRASKTQYNARGLAWRTETGTTTSATSLSSFAALQQSTITFDGYGRPTRNAFAAGGVTYSQRDIQYRTDNGQVNCVAARMNPSVFGSAPGGCALGSSGSFGSDRISQTVYDALNRPIRAIEAKGTSVEADVVETTYTTNGQVATLTDGEGNKTTYEYDAYDRRFKTRFPSKTAAGTSSGSDYEQYAFDAADAVTSFRNRAGQTITYALDNWGRVTASSGSGATSRTRTYDNFSRVTALTGGEAVSYAYDALGRVLSETQAQGTVSYQYDAAGRQTRIDYPGGFYVNYDYDVIGQMTKVRQQGAASGVGVL
ncbi:MAG: hypothetical protein AAGD92_03200, partial [Pseudomonadota bacterium]